MDRLAQDKAGGDTGQKAKDLARRQADVNQKLDELAKDPGAGRAQQAARQQQLEEQGPRPGAEARRPGQGGRGPDGQGRPSRPRTRPEAPASPGTRCSRPREAGRKGQTDQAGEARDQAAESMDRAAQQAGEAAKQLGGGEKGPAPRRPARRLDQAKGQMGEAGRNSARASPARPAGRWRRRPSRCNRRPTSSARERPGDGSRRTEPRQGRAGLRREDRRPRRHARPAEPEPGGGPVHRQDVGRAARRDQARRSSRKCRPSTGTTTPGTSSCTSSNWPSGSDRRSPARCRRVRRYSEMNLIRCASLTSLLAVLSCALPGPGRAAEDAKRSRSPSTGPWPGSPEPERGRVLESAGSAAAATRPSPPCASWPFCPPATSPARGRTAPHPRRASGTSAPSSSRTGCSPDAVRQLDHVLARHLHAHGRRGHRPVAGPQGGGQLAPAARRRRPAASGPPSAGRAGRRRVAVPIAAAATPT